MCGDKRQLSCNRGCAQWHRPTSGDKFILWSGVKDGWKLDAMWGENERCGAEQSEMECN